MGKNSSEPKHQTLSQCVNCVCGNLGQTPMVSRLLGLCPLLAVTTSVLKAFSIAVLLLLVGLLSVLLGSALRSTVVWRLKTLHFAVIASVSTLVVVNTVGIRFPAIIDALGIYALLLAANCQIISQLQESAEHLPIRFALPRVIKEGLWVLVFAVTIALIREFATYGTIFHDWLLVYGLPTQLAPIGWLPILAEPGGALIVLGIVLGMLNLVTQTNAADPDSQLSQPLGQNNSSSAASTSEDAGAKEETSQD